MSLKNTLLNSSKRVGATHGLLGIVIVINMLFFTTDEISLLVQGALLVVLWIHNKDFEIMKKNTKYSQQQLKADKDIFNRNLIVSESDLKGFITYANPKFCHITGYTKEELIGKSHNILRDPNTPASFYQELWNTIENKKTFHAKFKNINKDGTPYWVDTSITPIIVNSKVVGYRAIRLDITEQILAKEGLKHEIDEKEDLLKKQNMRFEFAINSSRDGFWDYDLVNLEFYLSSGWKKRLGFSDDEKLSYLDYLSLIPDTNRFEHHAAMQDVIEEYPEKLEFVHFRISYPLITKSGEKIIIDDVGDAFFDENGSLIRITGFHRDITDHERQAKIIESQNRLAAMGEMISNIAHQWRQPIAAINNVLNDVEFDIELEDLIQINSEKFLETSSKIKGYTNYLSQTIDDFRKISSDDKVKTTFYIETVLEEAKKIVQSSYEEQKIKLQFLMLGENNYEHIGYKRELIQVIINILNNAKDVSVEKKIVDSKVLVSVLQHEGDTTIIIHDNAGGIPEQIIEKIFEPYFTTKHESIGTGIGLYMSRKIIVDYFNGSLCVENENNGAKFIITIPKEV
ncbi:MAG: PAS domain S-box protein [Sulfurimonas sp.]|jgi:PAS domain S-box-containing protein